MVCTPVKNSEANTSLGRATPLIIDRYSKLFEPPPMCTRKEMCRRNPRECERIFQPRLVHTAPQVRMARRAVTADPTRPKIVTFRSDDNAAKLSYCYSPTSFIPYVEQLFTKISPLGQGSFGNVFSAKCVADGQYYAVKCAHSVYKSASNRKEKLREVRFLEKLVHPNIVNLHSAWEENDFLYMQTELCTRSLQKYIIDRDGEIPEVEAWNVLIDIARAVEFIHAHNVVHVDIKPDNILMSVSDINGQVFKLGDFGMAVDLINDTPDQMNRDGDARYLADEALNAVSVTKEMDIFSLGLSVLQAATDLWVPINGPRWREIRDLSFTQELISKISSALRIILYSMMAKDPSERPTAAAILQNPEILAHVVSRLTC